MHAHAGVRMKIGLLRHAIGIGDLAIHCVTQAPHHCALDLVVEINRINNGANVGSNEDLVDADASGCVADLDHLGGRYAKAVDESDAAAAIRSRVRAPPGHFRDGFQHFTRRGVIHQA